MEIQGLNKITKVIENFARNFDLNIKVDISTDFECQFDIYTIYYSLFVNEKPAVKFLKYIKKKYHFEPNYFVIALLHEIYHLKTWKDNSEFDFFISRLGDKIITHTFLPNSLHFHLPIERRATKAAVQWALANPTEIKNFCIELDAALQEFYQVNKLTNEEGE